MELGSKVKQARGYLANAVMVCYTAFPRNILAGRRDEQEGRVLNGQKKSQMMVGFNHNIKHKDRIFHVQTEDSGTQNPHIITHLFVGGNILATKKTSYADIVKAENLSEIVKELMEEQHKAMLRNLINGVYDEIDSAEADAGEPVQDPKPAPARAPMQVPAAAKVAKQIPPGAGKFPSPARPARTQTAIPRHEAQTQPVMPAAGAGFSAGADSGAGVLGTQIHKPPPDEIVPRVKAPQARVTIRPAAGPPTNRAAAPAGERARPAVMPPAAKGRPLPPEVLAARRLAEHPVPRNAPGPTIFGEDLISEKSLDEVILGYLSGEGDEGV